MCRSSDVTAFTHTSNARKLGARSNDGVMVSTMSHGAGNRCLSVITAATVNRTQKHAVSKAAH